MMAWILNKPSGQDNDKWFRRPPGEPSTIKKRLTRQQTLPHGPPRAKGGEEMGL